MFNDVPPLVSPTVARIAAATPSPEVQLPGESTMTPPSAEQAQSADRVFAATEHPQPLATLLGVATSFVLLRDLAIDNFSTPKDEDEEELKQPKPKSTTDGAD